MSTTLIEVRPAKAADAAEVASAHDEAWRSAYQGIIPGAELEKLRLGRNFLHAAELEFSHPLTAKLLSLRAPLPEALEKFLAGMEGPA